MMIFKVAKIQVFISKQGHGSKKYTFLKETAWHKTVTIFLICRVVFNATGQQMQAQSMRFFARMFI